MKPPPLHYSTSTKYTNGWQEAPLSDVPIQRPIFRPVSVPVGEYTAKLACQWHHCHYYPGQIAGFVKLSLQQEPYHDFRYADTAMSSVHWVHHHELTLNLYTNHPIHMTTNMTNPIIPRHKSYKSQEKKRKKTEQKQENSHPPRPSRGPSACSSGFSLHSVRKDENRGGGVLCTTESTVTGVRPVVVFFFTVGASPSPTWGRSDKGINSDNGMSRSSWLGTETSPKAVTAPPTGTEGTEEITGSTAERPVGKSGKNYWIPSKSTR